MQKWINRCGLLAAMWMVACGGGDGGAGDASLDGSGDGMVDTGPSCASGEMECGGACVDTSADPDHCGACDTTCGTGEVCNAGACALTCGGATPTECDGGCFDLMTSSAHCGDCATACGAGEVCTDGACTTSCPSTQVNCGGVCVDPQTDRNHCGASDACDDTATPSTAGEVCADGEVCAAGACATSCPAGQVNCGGVCVEPQTDRAHCGATDACDATATPSTAGVACAAGEVCAAGVCATSCPAGQIDCGGTCVDPATDPIYCGASDACDSTATPSTAGATCVSGEVCAAGVCATSCPVGQVNCGGRCVDPATDPVYCGASDTCDSTATPSTAGAACASGESCSAGACVTSCPAGELACGGSCVDPMTDRAHCGASMDCAGTNAGATCAAGEVCNAGVCEVSCPSGQIDCGGTCIDPNTDRTYCGAATGCDSTATPSTAGATCAAGEVCSGGACGLSCGGASPDLCGTSCTDLNTDRLHCGDCATACAAGEVCAAGSCQVSCPGGQVNCGGTCIDPSTDRAFCGASGDCAGVNAGAACAAGEVCAGGTCGLSCGGATPDLCGTSCVDFQTDRAHCGDCTTACAAGQVCVAGACVVSCPMGQINCGGTCIDPNTDRAFCGASGACDSTATPSTAGVSCGAGEVCAGGSCGVSCPSGQVNCAGTCVDPNTDRTHCGASGACDAAATPSTAGTTCAAGEVCVSGSCSASCASPLTACSGACVDTRNDPTHCGDCTTNCTPSLANATAVCAAGSCATLAVCQTGFGDCDRDLSNPSGNGCETNLTNSEADCGACGNRCAQGEACMSGVCTPCASTRPGAFMIGCSGVCVDAAQDTANCGGCGNDCSSMPGSPACIGGMIGGAGLGATCTPSCTDAMGFGLTDTTDCGTASAPMCTDTQTDPNNCGMCGNACAAGEVCTAGTCGACVAPTPDACGGTCTDTQADDSNCGSCGNACGGGKTCQTGACACPAGQVDCGGVCIDPNTSNAYCGATAGCGMGSGSAGAACGIGSTCTAGVCLLPASCQDAKAALMAAGMPVSDGLYDIDPAGTGTGISVYCRMNQTTPTDPGGWTLVYDQETSSGMFPTEAEWEAGLGTAPDFSMGDPDANYSILNRMADLAGSGSYEFWLEWEDLPGTFGPPHVHWIQGEDPLTVTNPATPAGFVALDADPSGQSSCAQSFTGLAQDASGNSLLDGNQNGCWWWAVGTTAPFPGPGGGVPAYETSSMGQGISTMVRLYMRRVGPPVATGLVAHYDAQIPSSIVGFDMGMATGWKDLSGNGYDMGSAGIVPTPNPFGNIGSHQVLDMNGAGLLANNVPLTRDITVFAVVQQNMAAAQWGTIVDHGNRDQDWALEQSGLDADRMRFHFQSANDNAGAELTLSTTPTVLVGRINGTAREFTATTSGGTTAPATGSGNNITVGNKPLRLGVSDLASETGNTWLGEVIYYNRALTDAERDSVIAYLTARWGI